MIAVDVVLYNVAVITSATISIMETKAVTSTIPMVLIGVSDPVALGLVHQSLLARGAT